MFDFSFRTESLKSFSVLISISDFFLGKTNLIHFIGNQMINKQWYNHEKYSGYYRNKII